MIKSELYILFKRILPEDHTEQVEFFEKYEKTLLREDAFDRVMSRNEFLKRIYVLHSCAIAYYCINSSEKAIEIFDLVISHILANQGRFGIDLKKEHYYINSLFGKGKALVNLGKRKEARRVFKFIIDSCHFRASHVVWYINQTSFLIRELDVIFLILFFLFLLIPQWFFGFDHHFSKPLSLFTLVLAAVYAFYPAKKVIRFISHRIADKYGKKAEKRESEIEYYSNKIYKNPNDYNALLQRGIYYELDGDFEKSLQDLNAALKINNNNSEALYWRAIVFEKLGNPEKALEDWNTLISSPDFEDADYFFSRGHCYLSMENYEGALSDFDRSIELEPHLSAYIYERALLEQKMGRHQEAIEGFTKVIKLEPENHLAHFNRGESKLALGFKDNAMSDFRRAKELGSDEAAKAIEKLEFYIN